MGEFSSQLASKLKKYTFSSSDDLIKETLVTIGNLRLKDNLTLDEREPAYKFWYKLDEISSGFQFRENCQEQVKDDSIELSKLEITHEKELIVADFLKHSYEEAMEELVSAAYSWLLCCRMEKFRQAGESERAAKLRYCKEWALEMGVT